MHRQGDRDGARVSAGGVQQTPSGVGPGPVLSNRVMMRLLAEKPWSAADYSPADAGAHQPGPLDGPGGEVRPPLQVRHYPSRLAELGGPMPMQIGMLTGPSGPIGSGGGGPPPGALLGLEGEALERALAREAALAAEAGSSAARRRGPGIPGWVFPVLLAAETLERRFQERIDAPGATSGEATLPGEPRPEGAEAPSGHEPYVTILDPQVWPGHGPVGDPADPARMELAPKGLGVPGRSVTPAGIRSGGGRRRLLWWQGDPEGRRKALEEYSDDDVFTADVRQSTDRLLERVVDGTTTPGDVKQLRSGDGLFEARHVNRGNQYRLLFFYWRDAVVVLSAFLKRENHMAREISRADERKARWLKVFGSDR